MSDLEYIGCNIYDKWKIRLIYKQQLSENHMDVKMTHKFLYPYISGWYRNKWTHNPTNINEFPEEVQKFCEETWTDRFKQDYKRWRESVGPWVE